MQFLVFHSGSLRRFELALSLIAARHGFDSMSWIVIFAILSMISGCPSRKSELLSIILGTGQRLDIESQRPAEV